jgi:hypothetical protein
VSTPPLELRVDAWHLQTPISSQANSAIIKSKSLDVKMDERVLPTCQDAAGRAEEEPDYSAVSAPSTPSGRGAGAIAERGSVAVAVARSDALTHVREIAQLGLGEVREEVLSHDG